MVASLTWRISFVRNGRGRGHMRPRHSAGAKTGTWRSVAGPEGRPPPQAVRVRRGPPGPLVDWLHLSDWLSIGPNAYLVKSAQAKEPPTIVTVWSRLVRLVARRRWNTARVENDGERSWGHALDLGRDLWARGGIVPPPPDGTAGFAPADVMTIRRLLEPLAMPLVVAWATAADFKEMDRFLSGGDRAGSYDEFETWDLALHRSIMAARHSPLLGRRSAVIETARHGHFWGDLKRRSASRERRVMSQADHTELVAALRARDAERAVQAMRTHLGRVNSDLFGESR